MKKLAEELLKIESNARRVEAEKAQLEDDCRYTSFCLKNKLAVAFSP